MPSPATLTASQPLASRSCSAHSAAGPADDVHRRCVRHLVQSLGRLGHQRGACPASHSSCSPRHRAAPRPRASPRDGLRNLLPRRTHSRARGRRGRSAQRNNRDRRRSASGLPRLARRAVLERPVGERHLGDGVPPTPGKAVRLWTVHFSPLRRAASADGPVDGIGENALYGRSSGQLGCLQPSGGRRATTWQRAGSRRSRRCRCPRRRSWSVMTQLRLCSAPRDPTTARPVRAERMRAVPSDP